jgi:hypothetical protein
MRGSSVQLRLGDALLNRGRLRVRRSVTRRGRKFACGLGQPAIAALPFVVVTLTFSTIELTDCDVDWDILNEQVLRPLAEALDARAECRLRHRLIRA